jgi:thiamine pyrophosphokinase
MGSEMMKRAIVFINGTLRGKEEFYLNYIDEKDTILCADGGAEYTFKLGVKPDFILGDLDSISPQVLEYYQEKDVCFEKLPKNKNKTDTQVLLEKLIVDDYNEIIIFAALGKRLDHTLGNLYLLEKLYTPDTLIKFVTPQERVRLIKSKTVIKDKIEKTVSLLPITSQVSGVNLSGFKYELEGRTFKRGETLGLSNIVKDNEATIDLEEGSLLLIINYS